ncbi:Nif3-like dinuclear metal center hexameric protein [Effusibacillus lacus]|uniref:GTP cyclohydrolase 1 type 2 homolog n=1 Tax=Effusibacillus lacus TaxID=1348429 RepID=A0A292YRF1_9BACL|nr:Nif3-like dinuclear metal center hexameric protein [Effusibacillus lacus]TCS70345.1 dinuclear metal center YbgI/SA1388 family protein [Effusibacillus lacus]GAX91499.1 Nif3-like dinuclear metal center hexameric protein [Effusibacillus lacus]
MQARVRDVIRVLEEWVSPNLALEGDKIGLQIGDPTQPVNKILVTLDVTEEVVDEAIRIGAQMIIAHHAIIYSSIKTIRTDTHYGRTISKLLTHSISVYAAHTNLDVVEGGVNDVLARLLGLQNVEILDRLHNQRVRKLVVFVPKSHHDQVLQAICGAGAGWIGNYSHCTFNMEGIGTFKPEEGTNPFIGEQGNLEKVEEIRLETIVPEQLQEKVVRAMLEAHPYEEVAYDLYPLEIMGKPFGIGRIGDLKEKCKLDEFAMLVKSKLAVPGVRIVGKRDRMVKKVAVLGGSGSDWIDAALSKGADVLVTADLKYHDAQDAMFKGLALVDPGHNGMERIVVPAVADFLNEALKDLQCSAVASVVVTEPFDFL